MQNINPRTPQNGSLPELTKQELTTQKLDSDSFLPLKQWRTIKEKEYIEKVLQFTGGSVTKAAEILDLDRTYLHTLIKKSTTSSRGIL